VPASSFPLRLPASLAAIVPLLLLGQFPGEARGFSVVSVQPASQSLTADAQDPIVIRFDEAIDRASVVPGQTFRASGRWSGPMQGSLEFSEGDTVVRWLPARGFAAGDRILVLLSHDIRAASGTPLRAAGYSFQYWTRTTMTPLAYREIQRFSVRSEPGIATRSYGGSAADFNGDLALDLAIVNEDTADLRLFLNSGDKQGHFEEVMLEPTRLGRQASPSETADFDGDGIVDLCVANIRDNSVTVLLGNGDGTFRSIFIPVGNGPRGITVLDADGDGDIDIVNTNSGNDNLCILLNHGDGTFAAPVFFDAGGFGEWALDAADFDHDGILDLAVGLQNDQQVVIQHGVGDGTFVAGTPRGCEGQVWQLNTGDVNGDGHTDVVVVNGTSNNAAILPGDAAGRLGRATIYLPDAFALATDLGDLDGDGDLDWITSSFSGDWFLYRNDGTGAFQFDQSIPSPSAASCALLLDSNHDGDLDVVLIDELADMIVVLENTHGSTAVEKTSMSRMRSMYRDPENR